MFLDGCVKGSLSLQLIPARFPKVGPLSKRSGAPLAGARCAVGTRSQVLSRSALGGALRSPKALYFGNNVPKAWHFGKLIVFSRSVTANAPLELVDKYIESHIDDLFDTHAQRITQIEAACIGDWKKLPPVDIAAPVPVRRNPHAGPSKLQVRYHNSSSTCAERVLHTPPSQTSEI